MNDSGTNYGNFEPIISNRIEQLYYLTDKALSHQEKNCKTLKEDQLFSTAQFCLEVEEKINDTIGFLMCNRVAPVVFKQYLNVLKTLNEYVITTKVNLKENNYLEKLEEIEDLNQRIDIISNVNKTSSFLPECLEIKHEIQEFIKVENKKQPNFPAYCEIGSLFAQGFLDKKIVDKKYIYLYRDKEFDDFPTFKKFVESKLNRKATIRQYLNDTLNNGGIKNFYSVKKQLQEIKRYCDYYNIQPTEYFIKKLNAL